MFPLSEERKVICKMKKLALLLALILMVSTIFPAFAEDAGASGGDPAGEATENSEGASAGEAADEEAAAEESGGETESSGGFGGGAPRSSTSPTSISQTRLRSP